MTLFVYKTITFIFGYSRLFEQLSRTKLKSSMTRDSCPRMLFSYRGKKMELIVLVSLNLSLIASFFQLVCVLFKMMKIMGLQYTGKEASLPIMARRSRCCHVYKILYLSEIIVRSTIDGMSNRRKTEDKLLYNISFVNNVMSSGSTYRFVDCFMDVGKRLLLTKKV